MSVETDNARQRVIAICHTAVVQKLVLCGQSMQVSCDQFCCKSHICERHRDMGLDDWCRSDSNKILESLWCWEGVGDEECVRVLERRKRSVDGVGVDSWSSEDERRKNCTAGVWEWDIVVFGVENGMRKETGEFAHVEMRR